MKTEVAMGGLHQEKHGKSRMENKSKICKELEAVDGMGSERNMRERRGKNKKTNGRVA